MTVYIFYGVSLGSLDRTDVETSYLRENLCHFSAPSGLITQIRQIGSWPHPPTQPTQRGGSPGGKEETLWG